MKLRLALLLSLAASLQAAVAQAPPVNKPAPSSHASASELPPPVEPDSADTQTIAAQTVSFSEGKPIPGAPSTALFMTPVACSSDGMPLIAIPRLHDFSMPDLYLLDTNGTRTLTPSANIPGLYDVHHRDHFVSDSTFGVLVSATKDDTRSPTKLNIGPAFPPLDVYTGQHHEYLLEYDLHGSFKQVVELPAQYHFHRLAPLPEDDLLALAYDPANAVARLLVLDSSGKILRTLEIPSQLQNDPSLLQGQTGDLLNRAKAESSFGWWQVASTRHTALLYHALTKGPLLEVGAAGATREVPLQSPNGYVLSSILPANDRWLVWFQREGLDIYKPIDTHPQAGNFVLYETDPSDGSLRRRIQLPPAGEKDPSYQITCEKDGSLIAITQQNVGPLLATAGLGR